MTPAHFHLCCYPQVSRDPLPPEAMNEIFEDVKDMGVLIGKGGIYGQVTPLTRCPSVFSSVAASIYDINIACTYITKAHLHF